MAAREGKAQADLGFSTTPRHCTRCTWSVLSQTGFYSHTGPERNCGGQYERETSLLAAFFGLYDILANLVLGLATLAIFATVHTGHAMVL